MTLDLRDDAIAEEHCLIRPVRLQLSRQHGFRLHQHSFAANGLECRRVDRATLYGNPFRHVSDEGYFRFTRDEETAPAEPASALVRMFRAWLDRDATGQALKARIRAELRGFNLACWCGLERACHADVELEIANG